MPATATTMSQSLCSHLKVSSPSITTSICKTRSSVRALSTSSISAFKSRQKLIKPVRVEGRKRATDVVVRAVQPQTESETPTAVSTESETANSIKEQARSIAKDALKDFSDIVARTNFDDMAGTTNEILAMEREMVIGTHRDRIVEMLSKLIVNESDKQEFTKLTGRVAAVIRAWYNHRFDGLMEHYSYFDPVGGAQRLKKERLSASEVDAMEIRLLKEVVGLMEKSNYKPLSLKEYQIATSCEYLINLPIEVNKKKLDSNIWKRFFSSEGVALKSEELPDDGMHYLLFRRGVGVDKTTDLFIDQKIDVLIGRMWMFLLTRLGIRTPEEPSAEAANMAALAVKLQRESKLQHKGPGSVETSDDEGDMHELVRDRVDQKGRVHFERIRLETLPLLDLFGLTTIQEPTFERIIVLYRPSSGKRLKAGSLGDRTLNFKQFKSIPMADVEMVLPEKKSPGLTPRDTLNYVISAVGGLAALFVGFEVKNFDLTVTYTIGAAVFAYFSKLYSAYQSKVTAYNQAMSNAMYGKQLDSGHGTLLNICHQVVEQEVKEVIIAFYILMTQGKASQLELDERCEDLMASEFDEHVNFDVADACNKLVALGLVTQDSHNRYVPVSLPRANEIIGVTTEEIMAKVVPT